MKKRPIFKTFLILITIFGFVGFPFSSFLEAQEKSKVLQAFNNPKATIEYHYSLIDEGLTEKNIAEFLDTRIFPALKQAFQIGAIKKPRWGIYVDSRDRALDNASLILRVREGQITVKSRASNPEKLLDLHDTGKKKYEIDYFDAPEYSISSDIRFTNEQFDVSKDWTIENLLNFIGKASPPLFAQIKPYLKENLEIPGKAVMYNVDCAILSSHPMAPRIKESEITVWFFPPTKQALVELSFVGTVANQNEVTTFYYQFRDYLKQAHVLHPVQLSKTERYFSAYFGAKP